MSKSDRKLSEFSTQAKTIYNRIDSTTKVACSGNVKLDDSFQIKVKKIMQNWENDLETLRKEGDELQKITAELSFSRSYDDKCRRRLNKINEQFRKSVNSVEKSHDGQLRKEEMALNENCKTMLHDYLEKTLENDVKDIRIMVQSFLKKT